LAGEPAGAGCGLVARRDVDNHRAVLADLTADGHLGVARVEEVALADPDWIAIGRLADALLGRDHDAPEPIIIGYRLGRALRRSNGDRERGNDQAAAHGGGNARSSHFV